MCRLRPVTFFPASYPRGPPGSVVLTDWLSRTVAEGCRWLPAACRRLPRSSSSSRSKMRRPWAWNFPNGCGSQKESLICSANLGKSASQNKGVEVVFVVQLRKLGYFALYGILRTSMWRS